ncbi:MAG: glycosyltransferase family 2 protein [Patescibacteria group bacterium]|nr:glycosyltransferase family 2 protein [Patescibacteria group bacterium]
MKLVIGVITYNKSTAKYLPYFLSSLETQSFKDFKIIVQDNSDIKNNENKKIIENNNSFDIEFNYSGENIGFARANNKTIKRAIDFKAEYILFLNPDMILESDMVEKLIKTMEKDKDIASAAPKILKWNFIDNKKTNIIDTCGIKEISALRFIDIGQGKIDKNQHDDTEILGPSGATALYRVIALEKVKDEYGYFDERMFMYKEDCDLAYRLKLAGYGSKLVKDAIVYHDRTAVGVGETDLVVALNRKNKSKQVKSWSYKNQHIIFKKHWKSLNLKRKIEVVYFAFKMFVYALLFEQYLLKNYKTL